MISNSRVTLAAVPLLLVAACAYNRPQQVTSQMTRTEAVLDQAENSGAEEVALSDLQQARDKYAEAEMAYEKETKSGDARAMRLARQAEVDAQYAAAKAQARQQQTAAAEIQEGVRTLREEATRNN